jgi:hypothetical protein
MSTTSIAPAPAAGPMTPPATGPVRTSALGAVRAFGVMLGGPAVLLSVTVAAAARTAQALRAGRPPCRGAAGVLLTACAYGRCMRPWMRCWGATAAELEMALPGDELDPDPRIRQTRAVQIAAPAHAVSPWIAQLGQDRGGFYSYLWLENLAGCRMHNADRIHPEWQQRSAGETVLLHPAAGLKVMRFEPGHALVLEGGWSLVVEPDGPHRCRLIARSRRPGGVAGAIYGLLLELPHFVMERRMLLEVKRRSEGMS